MPASRSILLTSWQHSDPVASRAAATAAFEALRAALENPKPGLRYPFDGPFEVALINAGTQRFRISGEVWMVGSLLPMEDTGNLIFTLRPWMGSLGVDWGACDNDFEKSPAEGTLSEIVEDGGWGTVVASFAGVAAPRAAEAAEQPYRREGLPPRPE